MEEAEERGLRGGVAQAAAELREVQVHGGLEPILQAQGGVARLGLLQGALAEEAAAPALRGDGPVPPLHAGAPRRAIAPRGPIPEGAVHARLARHLGVADLVLHGRPRPRVAALVRLHLDGARSPRLPAGASGRARLPCAPVGPLTIDAELLVALVEIAALDLRLVVGLTRLAAGVRGDEDVPRPGALAAVARAAAHGPIAPIAPLAVVALAPGEVGARLHLLEVLLATQAVRAPRGEGAAALRGARTAGGAARLPRRPLAHNAIRGVARLRIAAPRLHEVLGARLPARARVPGDLAVPRALAAAARSVARVPSRPLGDLAIRDALAHLRLFHGALARRARAQRLLQNGTDSIVHREAALARGPWAPWRELAVHMPRVAELRVALAQLFQARGTLLATVLGMLRHVPRARPISAAAILGARRPIPPLAKGAIHGRRHVPVARHGLIGDAAALAAAVRRRGGHPANARALVAGVRADRRLPRVPLAERTVDLVHALLCAHLRLVERALAWHAPALAGLADVPVSLAQLIARAIAPRRPIAEAAIHGRARRGAGGEVADRDVELVAGASALGIPGKERGGVGRRRRGRHHEVPRAGLRGVAASRATVRVRPLRPNAVPPLLARARAVVHLLGRGRVALLPACVRKGLNLATSVALPAALDALAPIGPRPPHAVLTMIGSAPLRVARHELRQRGVARGPVVRGGAEHLSAAASLPAAAIIAARGPRLPLAELASPLRVSDAPGWSGGAIRQGVALPDILRTHGLALRAVANGILLDVPPSLLHAEARGAAV
mmetsp:Transcript_43991/g.124253  ORF Transcript_43991/g.124253 Transcript_43991/m.124253 type:complete len:788 (-) Transcript_43991:1385-3748(-)